MQIRLVDMKLKNFKGVKSFELKLDGRNANVNGDNATGKTTLFDAWKWLLFDKDSSNRSDFSIKTIDPNGDPIHFLEHEVEAKLEISEDANSPVYVRTFKKQLTEKWVKKRGQEEQEFSGHETSYWIDEVPMKKSEYQKVISDLIDENVFKLITDPFYFNNMLKKEERRKIIIEIAGDISDAEVIAAYPKLKRLPEILENRSIDNFKKMLAEKIKMVNDEIKQIPPRVDELNHSLSDGLNIDYKSVEEEIALYSDKLLNIEKRLTESQTVAQDKLKIQQEIIKAKDQLNDLKLKLEKDANAVARSLADKKQKLENEQYALTRDDETYERKLRQLQSDIDANEIYMAKLRIEFTEEDAKVFPEPEIDTTCPTCGQDIPSEQIQSKYAEMKKKFMAGKEERLDLIEAKGRSAAENNKKYAQEQLEIQSRREANNNRLKEIHTTILEIEDDISKATVEVKYELNPEYIAIENQIIKLQKELDKPVEDIATELMQEKKEFTGQLDELKKILNNKEVNDKTKARIQELKDQEKELSKRIIELEGQKFLVETFIKAKVELIEDKINSMFKYVRFKLFDVQINGGVNEVCDTLIKGVPWQDANHEGRTNAGLDIINTLTKFYGVNAPIFIDYRESVNKIIDTDSQVINLVVTKDKALNVEVL